MEDHPKKLYKLVGADGKPYFSEQKGILGGHRKLKIYGRLDCPSALRHIARGGYVKHRVFFADEKTAVAAGYRPCAVCMKEQYAQWKQKQKKEKERIAMPRISFPNNVHTVCEIETGAQEIKRLSAEQLREPPVRALLRELEGYRIEVEGPYAVITLSGASEQNGFTIVWDYENGTVPHISKTPFAVCSAVAGQTVVTLYLVSFWGHPADLWYSLLPLNTVNTSCEPDRIKLELTAEDVRDPFQDCRITVSGNDILFHAGKHIQRIRRPRNKFSQDSSSPIKKCEISAGSF